MPHSGLGSQTVLNAVLYCNETTRDPEGFIFDAPNRGNRVPNDSCTPKKKDRLHPDPVLYGLGAR